VAIMTDLENQEGCAQQGAKVPEKTAEASSAAVTGTEPKGQQENVPEWLGSRLRQMFTEVMHEPVPDEFAALLKQLEDKERR
jgi:hypothetical protein